MVRVKTTVDLDDALVRRAKARAAVEGSSLRSVVEQALRQLLEQEEAGGRPRYVLPDRSVDGDGPSPDHADPAGWREAGYGGRGR